MSDTYTDRPPCALCGVHGRPDEIRTRVVAWIDAAVGDQWDAVPRCEDRLACRQRVESKDPPERWPVVHMSGDPWSKEEHAGPLPRSRGADQSTTTDVLEEAAAPPEAPMPPTWSPTFVDEPEEERSWI